MSRVFFPILMMLISPFVVGCASVSAWYHPSLTQIRSDLPPGTSMATVDAYLDQHQIDHTYYAKSNQITAFIHNIQRDALVREDLNLVFSFDEDKSLRDILAKPVYTSP